MEKRKMIKKEIFGVAIEVLEGVDFDNKEEVITGLKHEIELLEKKRTNKTMSAKQKENETLKEKIVETLSKSDKGLTISEIQSLITELADLSNQRVSALLTQLVNAGTVVRVYNKKKAYFSIAE